MLKKLVTFLTALFVFAALSFTAMDQAEAKGYKSGKKSFTPSQNQPSNSSPNSNIQKTTPDTKPAATTKPAAQNKGSFAKGLLLGGLGGLLLGSLFAGLGPIGSILAFLVNMLLFAGIIMIGVKLFKHFKKKREQEVRDTWKR
jgi:predicted lipid-binding transport protein (Tim44 family)